MSKRLKLQVFVTVLTLVCLTATIGYLPSAHANIGYANLVPVDPNLTAPSGTYRWLDVANQAYGTAYQHYNVYSHATVNVAYYTTGSSLSGTLTASNLKPNFAYQLKLVGTPGTADNERIGLSGRWWQEEWNGTAWTNGQNLNNKGDGSSPNPNDQTYLNRCDVLNSSSSTGYQYRFTGYLVFDYFITDNNGAAAIQFETGSSYHVLWKTSQQSSTINDGPIKTTTFDPSPSQPAYDNDYPSNTISIFGEWERLPPGQVNLQAGEYNCQIVLTEESFHGSGGSLAGNWAGVMTANLNFLINAVPNPPFPLPEYPLGALIGLSACIAAFAVYKAAKNKNRNRKTTNQTNTTDPRSQCHKNPYKKN